MILVGQYDSPYVRRVAVSLRRLGLAYEHDQRSVFGDFESMRATNPLGRVPSLILDDGSVLIDSGAILDWLDETVGPDRALMPQSGTARRDALRRMAIATGAADKAIALVYERIIRPKAHQWPAWIERLKTQAATAIAALEGETWLPDTLGQAEITTVCMLRYVEMTAPDLLSPARHPALAALAARCEGLPEFEATYPPDVVYPDPQ